MHAGRDFLSWVKLYKSCVKDFAQTLVIPVFYFIIILRFIEREWKALCVCVPSIVEKCLCIHSKSYIITFKISRKFSVSVSYTMLGEWKFVFEKFFWLLFFPRMYCIQEILYRIAYCVLTPYIYAWSTTWRNVMCKAEVLTYHIRLALNCRLVYE